MVKRRLGNGFLAFGVLLLLAAFALTFMNIRTDNAASQAGAVLLERLANADPMEAVRPAQVLPDAGEIEEEEAEEEAGEGASLAFASDFSHEPPPEVKMPTQTIDGRAYIGTILIPRLGIELPVLDECTDTSIAIAPGRFSGTAYDNGFVLGGHNYISHFGRINRLKEGDQVVFTDIDGRSWFYEVAGSEVIDGRAASKLCSSEWALSLFTCTFSGTERLTIRCRLAEAEPEE